MVVMGDFNDFIRELAVDTKNFCSKSGMLIDLLPLGGCQGTWLVEKPEWHFHLSNIMQQCAYGNPFDVSAAHSQSGGKACRQT